MGEEKELLNNSSPFSSFPIEWCTVDPCNHEIDPLSLWIEGVNVGRAEKDRQTERQAGRTWSDYVTELVTNGFVLSAYYPLLPRADREWAFNPGTHTGPN